MVFYSSLHQVEYEIYFLNKNDKTYQLQLVCDIKVNIHIPHICNIPCKIPHKLSQCSVFVL